MWKIYNAIIGLLLASTTLGVAQDTPLTLTEYCRLVEVHSYTLKQRSEQLLAAEYRTKVARTNYLPSLDFEATATLDLRELNAWTGVEGEYRNHTYLGQLSVTQPIYSGGGIRHQYRANKVAEEQARVNREQTLDDINYNASVVYWSAVANLALYEATELFIAIVKQQYEVVEIRFENGAIAQSDLLMIATRLKEAELQLSLSLKNSRLSMQSLSLMMGENPSYTPLLADSIYTPMTAPLFVSLPMALEARSDYRFAHLAIEIQEHNRGVELSAYNPTLALSLQGGWGTTTPNTSYDPNFSGLAALTLQVPIPYAGDRRGTSRANKATIRTLQWQMSETERTIWGELAAAQTAIIQSERQIELADENLVLATKNLSLATFSYQEGRIPMVDVLSAQLSWIEAHASRISAYLAHKVALADYVRASGGDTLNR